MSRCIMHMPLCSKYEISWKGFRSKGKIDVANALLGLLIYEHLRKSELYKAPHADLDGKKQSEICGPMYKHNNEKELLWRGLVSNIVYRI